MAHKSAKAIAVDLARRVRRGRLRELRTLIREAKKRRREAVKRVRVQCRASRVRLRQRIKERRQLERERVNAEIARMRAAAKHACACRLEKVKALGEKGVNVEKRRLEEQRRHAADRAEGERLIMQREAIHKKIQERQRHAESDDEVRGNLLPELVPVFNRMRKTIRGIPGRMTRTEAFLQWVHDNSHEVAAMQNEAAEADTEKMIAEFERLEREHYGRAA